MDLQNTENIVEYPLSIEHIRGNAASEIIPLHWHIEVEFLFLEQGQITITLEHDKILLEEDQCLFINSNQLHQAVSSAAEGCSLYSITFHTGYLCPFPTDLIYFRFIEPVVKKHVLLPNLYTPDVLWQAEIIRSIHNILDAYKFKLKGYQLAIKSEVFSIWFKCILNSELIISEAPEKSTLTDRIRIVLSYIHNHYTEKIMLSDIAQTIALSEGQFCRFFKKSLNCTPFTYINEYRIRQSCDLLKNTNKKIAEIAGLVGFDNISYYNKLFLKFTGCTPLKYRKQTN